MLFSTLDIDECEVSNGGCDQNCTNIPAGYKCSCFTGYNLSTDNSTCDGMCTHIMTVICYT